MIATWGLILGLPLLALGGGLAFATEKSSRLIERFRVSRLAAAVLSAIAWAWTAYECDIIGIDVFDMMLKRFPGQLWFMAALLCFLTCIWMPKNLPVRALSGILMLIPAELFKVTRLLVPTSGVAPVHLFVVTAYVGAIVGMYGMFYPWRIERAMEMVVRSKWLAVPLGLVLAAVGLGLVAVGFSL